MKKEWDSYYLNCLTLVLVELLAEMLITTEKNSYYVIGLRGIFSIALDP